MAHGHARPWVGIYVLPSTLLVRDCDGNYERTVGDGLFTSVRLARGALVGWMNGELVDREMYDFRCSGGRGGYGILVRGGLVLDCYEEYLLGRCPMSYIISARGAFLLRDDGTYRACRNNCEYVLHGYAVSVRTLCVVVAGSELLACYGTAFTEY